jgi:F0F1-type ATP synthase membrane subunit c/vacuolar-type H+-ATPase subunit K
MSKWNQTGVIKTPMGLGLSIGVAIGCGVGVALENLAIGLGVGIAMGVAVGIAIKKEQEKNLSKLYYTFESPGFYIVQHTPRQAS